MLISPGDCQGLEDEGEVPRQVHRKLLNTEGGKRGYDPQSDSVDFIFRILPN